MPEVVIVTGASRGIGRAISERFALSGADLAIFSRNQDEISRTAAEIESVHGVKVLGIACDVANFDNLSENIEKIYEYFGKIDVLVNNAGISPDFGPIKISKESSFDAIMRVNIMAPYALCREVSKKMLIRKTGSIVNISSVTGFEPGAGMGLYSVSKAALNMLTRVMASELGGYGIRVNGVAPGLVKTSLSRPLWMTDSILDKVTGSQAIKRTATPEEVAEVVFFLSSEMSLFITGQTIIVDGGGRL